MDLRHLAICLVASVFVTAAHGNDTKAQGSGPNPYTECGIGAALFPTVGWAAATSNATWDLGSTAITSAYSSPEMCNAKKVDTARLILETLPSLERDIALVDGEYLAALHDTMGCEVDSRAEINAELRSMYAKVVSDQDYQSRSDVERAAELYSVLRGVLAADSSRCGVTL